MTVWRKPYGIVIHYKPRHGTNRSLCARWYRTPEGRNIAMRVLAARYASDSRFSVEEFDR